MPAIGLRVPGHQVALVLLDAFGGGLAAPSANRFSHISPTAAVHVLAELDGRIEAVLDGGACAVGPESTILDLSSEKPCTLRPGVISAADISAFSGEIAPGDAAVPRAPGRLEAHYAPGIPLRLVELDQFEFEFAALAVDENLIVMARENPSDSLAASMRYRWIKMPVDPAGYGAALYVRLREADAMGPKRILVVLPPRTEPWETVHDRLMRATAGAGERHAE
jgi:L-threonylcarbamoyladenylate synthase